MKLLRIIAVNCPPYKGEIDVELGSSGRIHPCITSLVRLAWTGTLPPGVSMSNLYGKNRQLILEFQARGQTYRVKWSLEKNGKVTRLLERLNQGGGWTYEGNLPLQGAASLNNLSAMRTPYHMALDWGYLGDFPVDEEKRVEEKRVARIMREQVRTCLAHLEPCIARYHLQIPNTQSPWTYKSMLSILESASRTLTTELSTVRCQISEVTRLEHKRDRIREALDEIKTTLEDNARKAQELDGQEESVKRELDQLCLELNRRGEGIARLESSARKLTALRNEFDHQMKAENGK